MSAVAVGAFFVVFAEVKYCAVAFIDRCVKIIAFYCGYADLDPADLEILARIFDLKNLGTFARFASCRIDYVCLKRVFITLVGRVVKVGSVIGYRVLYRFVKAIGIVYVVER